MSKTILVTGASGFLASHVVLQLLAGGHRVRGSVRNEARAGRIRKALDGQGARTERLDFVRLDLTSDHGWAAAMDGIDFLVHTASPFVTYIPDDEDELIRPAVEGTERALRAALDASVKRVVLTSSEAAVVRGHPKNRNAAFSEADWAVIDGPGMTPYFRSKTLAEQKAWQIMEAAGRRADLTVINPGFILGPLLDDDVGTSGALIQRFMKGGGPGMPRLVAAVVDVRDVAELHVRALDDARGFGRRILIANDTVTFGDLADTLAAEFPERGIVTRRLPDWLVRVVGLFDREARGAVPMLRTNYQLEHELAEAMLGRALVGTNEAVLAMARSQVTLGLV